MLQRIPKVVTLAIREDPHASLLPLIDELADLHVGSARFALRDRRAFGSLSRAAARAIGRGLRTTIALEDFDAEVVMDSIALDPFSIAVPLHGPDLGSGWRDSVHLLSTIRGGGITAEVESRITHANATGLLPLWAAASVAGATRWLIECGIEKLSGAEAASVASTILDVAAGDPVEIVVHELPVLRMVLLQEMIRRDYRVPDLRRITLLERDDLLVVESSRQLQSLRSAFSTAMARG